MKRCKNCKSWKGSGIEVDHAHCNDPRSPHQTTSKNGNRDYDICLYWTEKPYKFDKEEQRRCWLSDWEMISQFTVQAKNLAASNQQFNMEVTQMPKHWITAVGSIIAVACGMYLLIATARVEFGMGLITMGFLGFGLGRKLDRLDKP